MYTLNCLIIIIKLLVIMGVDAAPTFSHLTNNRIINSAKDINQQQQQHHHHHTAALSLLQSTITTTTTSTTTSASAAILSSTSTSTNTLRLRKRHRKRSSWSDYNNYNENSTILEWSNPCGGEYNPNAKKPKRPTKKEQKGVSIEILE